jgi:ribosomal protein S18 acetylase RimI-like enzyme
MVIEVTPRMPISIRPMIDSDWPFVERGLCETNWQDLTEDQKLVLTKAESDMHIIEDFQRYLRTQQFKFRVFIATVERGEPVGYISVGELQNPAVGLPMGGILDFWVEPSFRRQGIGTRLLQYALDHITSHGYSHASILVSVHNSAKRIYEKAGFYADRQIMVKAIKQSNQRNL